MKKIVFATIGFLLASSAMAADPVYIGLDAEFGHKSSTSAQACCYANKTTQNM